MALLSEGLRNGRLAAICTALDVAAEPAFLRLYGGESPGGAGPVNAQALAEARVPLPSMGSLQAGVLTLAAVPSVLAVRSGTAAWARLSDGAGRWVLDLTVGPPGSDAELQLSSTMLYAGGTINFASITFTE